MMAKIAHALIIAGLIATLCPLGHKPAVVGWFVGFVFVVVLVLRLVLDALLGAKKDQQNRTARQSYRPW